MTSVITIVKFLTTFLSSIPIIENIVKEVIEAASEALRDYEIKKFGVAIDEAIKKAEETHNTSDLEHLAGKPK
jgi:hypothetical protein